LAWCPEWWRKGFQGCSPPFFAQDFVSFPYRFSCPLSRLVIIKLILRFLLTYLGFLVAVFGGV
jgi:hypothetical protein